MKIVICPNFETQSIFRTFSEVVQNSESRILYTVTILFKTLEKNVLYQTLLKKTIFILLFNISFIEAKVFEPPNGLSSSEWENIQSQINDKSLPQVNAILDQNYLKASNVDANINVADGGDDFGGAVAIDGDTLVVGARFEDGDDGGTENNSGAAYVFVKSNGAWVEQAYLRASNPGSGDQFGVSVGISGDTIIVGSHLEDTDTGNSGAVYVYTRTMNVWSFQTMLKASNLGANDFFAYSIAIDTGTIIIGAYKEDGDDSSSLNDYGAAYVFTGAGNSWSQQTKLTAGNFEMGDNFGYSVSISGNTAVIGAYKEDGIDDGNQDDSGAAYVFLRSGTAWTQQAYLKASNVGANDNFGVSVGVSGDIVVVGAFNEDGDTESLPGSGAAYVYTRTGMVWSGNGVLRADNAGIGDLFGTSVSIDGNSIVVGAKFENGDGIGGLDNDNAFNAGAAYLFKRTGMVVQQTYIKASNADTRDEFGIAVAVSGSTIIVGAQREDSAFVDNPADNTFVSDAQGAGAAYVYSPPDMMFTDGFEAPVVMKLFQYLSKIQSNSQLEQVPVYDSQSNSLAFYGHSLKLKNNYAKKDILEVVKFWLHEILIEEGLSGQYGSDVIF